VIHEELSHARPDYCFLMEESGAIEGADKTHRWIIDPLDGTTNFLHGLPLFTISIGLERDGELVAGLIYNPIAEELYTAEKGNGAFLNDRRIRVAARQKLDQSVICCGIPHYGRGDHELFFTELRAILPKVAGIRRTGSSALDMAWVASGKFDGFWERGLSPWDIAAGIVIVREAGGFVSDFENRQNMLDSGNIIAGNATLQPEICKTLRSARK
jgi:myo-inositol-1(or 4)-monophosphatase